MDQPLCDVKITLTIWLKTARLLAGFFFAKIKLYLPNTYIISILVVLDFDLISEEFMKKAYNLIAISFIAVLGAWTCSAASPTIDVIGPEEAVPTGAGRLTSIATDSDKQPHIVADGGSMAYFYDKVDGKWQSSSLNVSSVSGSRQYYNPHVEIIEDTAGAGDVAWYSGILFGSMTDGVGIGLITRTHVEKSPSTPYFSRKRVIPTSWDTGVQSCDVATKQCTVWVSGGYWQTFAYTPGAEGRSGIVNNGRLYIGIGGEANTIWISKAGAVQHGPVGENANQVYSVWHMGTCGAPGYDNCNYNNSLRYSNGQPAIPWCIPSALLGFGDDGVYTGLSSDNINPEVAYICTSLSETHRGGQGVWGNVYDGTAMTSPPESPLAIDPVGGSGMRRFAPQFAPHQKGGAWVTWTRGGYVMMRYISDKGKLGAETQICPGTMASICADKDGDLHLAYNAGGIKYRKIEVSGTQSEIGTLYPLYAAADFTGDGYDDIASFLPKTGRWFIRDSATGQQMENSPFTFGDAQSVPVAYDYNNNGRAQLAVYQKDTGEWRISKWDGNRLATSGGNPVLINEGMHFGGGEAIPVPGQYMIYNSESLGWAEPAVYFPRSGKWYIYSWASNKALEVGTRNYIPFGGGTALPVPRDYDGDGRTDIAVYYPGGGNWYFYDWETRNKTAESPIHFGGGAAIPAPADYSGNGQAEMCVFFPGMKRWFIRSWETGGLWPVNRGLYYAGSKTIPMPGNYFGGGRAELAAWTPNTVRRNIMDWKTHQNTMFGDKPYLTWGSSEMDEISIYNF